MQFTQSYAQNQKPLNLTLVSRLPLPLAIAVAAATRRPPTATQPPYSFVSGTLSMMLARGALRSLSDGVSYQLQKPQMIRAFSINWGSVDGNNRNQNPNTSESVDDFERRIFDKNSGDNIDSFFQKLDKVERFGKSGSESNVNGGTNSSILDGLHKSFNTLQDDMDGKLMNAATSYFEINPDVVDEEDFTFRDDMNFTPGMTYEPKHLDLRKPGVWRPFRKEFETTTKEVLNNADFRNVGFLANFLTEAGIMIKRSQTGISAKAQRKVAREIKTARAFGLMPFTTMGTKAFKFGMTMESLDGDFEYSRYEDPLPDADATKDIR